MWSKDQQREHHINCEKVDYHPINIAKSGGVLL